jgi:hypothetical protein
MNRKNTEEFNGRLNVPVKWQSGFKPTAECRLFKRLNPPKQFAHIQLLENHKAGKLKRSAGEFLCGYVVGLPYVDQTHYQDEDELGKYDSKITCNLCLKLAKRWGN